VGKGRGEVRLAIDADTGISIPDKLGLLVTASGVANILTAAIYIIALAYPQLVLTGYIHGYVSLVTYSLSYIGIDGEVYLANLESVKIPAIAALAYVVAILALSALSVVTALKGRFTTSAALSYGLSLSLVVTSGILRYLSQAFQADEARILRLLRYENSSGTLVLRTSAGVIEYPGIDVSRTVSYQILLDQPLYHLVPMTVAVALSFTSLATIIYLYSQQTPGKPKKQGIFYSIAKIAPLLHKKSLRITAPGLAIALALAFIGASTYSYYPTKLTIAAAQPPIVFEKLPYTNYCTNISRVYRKAIIYTDFEADTASGWVGVGGTWSYTSGVEGAKGYALLGSDSVVDGGVGGGAVYYSSNRIDSRRLWIVTKLRLYNGGGYFGVGFFDIAGQNIKRAVTAEIRYKGDNSAQLDIWSYNVKIQDNKNTGQGVWSHHNNSTSFSFDKDVWYILAVNYSIAEGGGQGKGAQGDMIVKAYLYTADGEYVTSVTATISIRGETFKPTHVGVVVDEGSSRINDTGGSEIQALFDDFIVLDLPTNLSDPKMVGDIVFSGFLQGYSVSIVDDLGSVVYEGQGSGENLTANIFSDIVLGTGVDGRIAVMFPDGAPCLVHAAPDGILGGDSYKVSFSRLEAIDVGAAHLYLNASISASNSTLTGFVALHLSTVGAPYYIRLRIEDTLSSLEGLTANITLYRVPYADPVAIRIVNGAVINSGRATPWIIAEPGTKIGLALVGYTSASTGNRVLLHLEVCTNSAEAVCAYYPIELGLSPLS